MARTAPSALITTMAACASDPSRTWSGEDLFQRGLGGGLHGGVEGGADQITSSVVSLVRKSGPRP
jgi:hypothetical protein